jgi:3alpha(or 20beta)-hydroxysteroid dehydrogenase
VGSRSTSDAWEKASLEQQEEIMARASGRTALVTGAARGIGAAIAERLTSEGARVVLADVLDEDGTALAGRLGDGASYVHLDVTDRAQWAEAVAKASAPSGGLDILVNNAGIVNFGSIEEYSYEQWDHVINVNLNGVFNGIKAAIPALKASGNASVVNISSIAGIRGYEALPGYTASKFGVTGLTKSAALDLARYGIRVNSVHPGAVLTPMTEGLALTTSHVALNRVGQPEEIAELVLYLSGAESSFVTGAQFVIDGGETAGLAHHPVGPED